MLTCVEARMPNCVLQKHLTQYDFYLCMLGLER